MPTTRSGMEATEEGAASTSARTTELKCGGPPNPVMAVTFGGRLEEDPRLFLEAAMDHFQRNAIPERDWVALATARLHGEAEAWLAELPWPADWQEFEGPLRGKFGSAARRERGNALYLYGRQEAREEPLGFIMRKKALARRFSNHSEKEIISHTMKLLTPECRLALMCDSSSWSELLTAAAGFEGSHGGHEEWQPPSQPLQQNRWQPPAQPQQQNIWQPPAQPNQQNRWQPPAQPQQQSKWQSARLREENEQPAARPRRREDALECWHCSGPHFNRFCPNRAQKTKTEPAERR